MSPYLGLIVTFSLLMGLLYFLRRTAGRSNPSLPVRVLQRQPLTPKSALYVIRIADQQFLLAAGDTYCTIIHQRGTQTHDNNKLAVYP